MIEHFSKMKMVKLLLSFMLSLITITWTSASHLRAGEITVERRNCTSREVWITITVYTNTASEVKFGEDGILYFGDNTKIVVPRVENVLQPHLGQNIGIATYTVRHTYGSLDSYLISYVEPNRNGGVLNMTDSYYTTFYLETKFSLAVLGCNYSPKLKIPPIDQACAGVAFFHNPGAYDFNPVGPTDSISYELATPYRDRGLPVVGYIKPNEYGDGEREEGGAAIFDINKVDGTMIWDSPDVPGEYNVAFNVIEWRKIGGIWKKIGYVRRDMQIIVNGDCKNDRPEIDVPNDTCVVAGSTIHKLITGYDRVFGSGTPDDIKIQAFSEIFEFPPSKSPATRSPVMLDADDFEPSPLTIEFNWNTTCDHIKGQPYDVVFKITDNPTNGAVNLATFRTWKITVVAPAPVLTTAIVPTDTRNVQLTWDNYDCASIADESTSIQVWRRVDDTDYMPGNCDTGMPESLGFSLIGITALTATDFLDTNNGQGLERGVKYCYRLVAVFGNRGAESYVSNEVCIDPIDIAAPLITQVTVDRTGENDGEITVSWLPPLNNFEIRPDVEFDDYEYELQRVNGDEFISVSSRIAGTSDSTAIMSFMDAGLNTLDEQYAYRVMLYINGETDPVDSSSIASSVWLNLTTADSIINLNWAATVPWSNQIELLKHAVHRGDDGAVILADLDPDPLDSVIVTTEGLRYRDSNLNPNQVYCYAVVTQGSYGNDDTRVPYPIVNRSQINCATPTVLDPPCEPVIAAFGDPCKDFESGIYACNSSKFSVTVRWSMPAGSCEEDIIGYKLYYTTTEDGRFDLYKNVMLTDTFAILEDQAGLAFCFKVIAVDRSGNESAFSETVCSENCPNYELPNVFTPNDDDCNDTFDAYGVIYDVPDGGADCIVRDNDILRCARFVERVDFKVYNRWGKKIYDYIGQRENENSIYIKWNGRDNSGKELASGIYFYSADVTFLSTRQEGTVKTIKGWVHLIR
jgi:hypothetical protein